MLSRYRFLLSGLLAGALPLAAFAQTETPAAFKPQLFVGLGVSVGSYRPSIEFYDNTVSPALTVGGQLGPRLAVQVSSVYSQQSNSYGYTGLLYINGGLHQGVSSGTSRQRIVAVPVLMRYTLTRRPARRFQVDLLGGTTVLRSTYRSMGTTIDSLQRVVSANDYRQATTTFCLALGPGLRYRMGQHLDLTSEYIFNILLNNRSYSSASAALTAGLRYRFGRS